LLQLSFAHLRRIITVITMYIVFVVTGCADDFFLRLFDAQNCSFRFEPV